VSPLNVEVLGEAVAISAPSPLLVELQAVLADIAGGGRSADRELTLSAGEQGFDLRDGGRLVRGDVAPSVAVATVVWHLNAIAAESTDHVLVHAGCVAGPSGRGVLLPGGPGAGKSTLTRASVAAGLTYLSDELAAVELRTGRLVPYAKPFVFEHERLVRASSIGHVVHSATAAEPMTPGTLVFPRYVPGARLTNVALDSGWALLALAAHTTNLAAAGGRGLAWLAGMALACPALQLTFGDVRDAVAAVEREVVRRSRPVAPAELLPPIAYDTTAVAVGDALAVLHEPSGSVHLLNAGAAAVWCRAAGAADAVDPTSGAMAERGADQAMTAATIDKLVRAGLLPEPAGA
jgi:hypothetical protein